MCCNQIAVKYRCAASEAVRYTGCKAAWEQSRSPLINTGKVKGVVLTVHDLSCTKKREGISCACSQSIIEKDHSQ